MSLFGDIRDVARTLKIRSVPYTTGTQTMPGLFGSGVDRTAQLETMGSLGTIFAIVDGIATQGALLDWTLYRARRPGTEESTPKVPVTQHAVLDLWNRPNPFFTRQELVEVSLQHLNLVGEAWWIIVRDQRSPMPLELWPVRPDRMAPVPHPTDFISGYVYTAPGGQKVPLGVDDVVFIRRPNPLDPYRGLGPVQAVLTDVDASRYTAEWNRRFFLNSAQPAGAIQFDGMMSDNEFRRFRDRWAEQHQGVDNAHKVAILERGGTWVNTSYSMKDMQFGELREASAEIIRRAWRWPSALNGDSGDINRATAQAHEYMAGKWIIDPQMARIAGGLTDVTALFYPEGSSPDVEWSVKSAVPEDEELENAERTSKASAWASLVGAGGEPGWAAEVAGLPAPPAGYAPPSPQPAFTDRFGATCPSCGMVDVRH